MRPISMSMSQDFTWSAMKRPTPLFWLCTKSASTRTMPRLISARIAGSRASWPPISTSMAFELAADLAVGGPRILLEEGAQALPGAFGDGGDLRPRQQVALQALGAAREGLRVAQALDEARHKTVELAAQRMVRIGPRLLDEGGGRGHDLAQQVGVGAVEVEQRRQLLADLFAQRRSVSSLVSTFSSAPKSSSSRRWCRPFSVTAPAGPPPAAPARPAPARS